MKNQYIKAALDKLIGMTKEEANAYMAAVLPNHQLRLVREDRRGFMVTMDMKMNRHDVCIDNGVITKVS